MPRADDNLISIPFGQSREEQKFPRYDWDNRNRGADSFVIFQYTHAGAGEVVFGGRPQAVPPGHALIALPPEASRYRFPARGREPWVFSWINFYGDLALRLWAGLRERSGPVVPLAPPAARMLEALIAKTRRSGRGWRDPYEASGAAYRFHLEVLRGLPFPEAGAGAARPLGRSIAYLRDHYREPLRMKEVAALAGVSREHFTRLFFKQAGQSPAAFLRQVRVEAAARLLRSTGLPVAEVAFRSGFASATQLGIAFRRRLGLSPAAYRERAG